MCIAIFKPAGKRIPPSYLHNSWGANPDGGGFCFANNGELTVEKGFFNRVNFINRINQLTEYPALIHFRWSTHGAINAANCHPWKIDDTHAMIHNGVIKGFGKLGNGRSDTGDFTEFILKPMLASSPDIWQKPWFISMMTRALERDGNKVLIMDNQGEVAIYGADLGHWHLGCWFSNHDYLPPRKIKK